MNNASKPRRPATMGRICAKLGIAAAIFLAAALLLAMLPNRLAGPLMHLRTLTACAVFAAGAAWVVLSALGAARALIYLVRLRRPALSARTLLGGLATLLLGCFPLALLAAGLIMSRMPDKRVPAVIPPLNETQLALREALKADVWALAGEIGDRNVITRYPELCAAADYIEAARLQQGLPRARATS